MEREIAKEERAEAKVRENEEKVKQKARVREARLKGKMREMEREKMGKATVVNSKLTSKKSSNSYVSEKVVDESDEDRKEISCLECFIVYGDSAWK